MRPALEELLRKGLEVIARDLKWFDVESLIRSLKIYFSELSMWNPKLGLIEAGEEEIITHHFLDCVSGIPIIRERAESLLSSNPGNVLKIADLGSGSGLPGVIIALLLGDLPVQVHLIEKQERRCGFLRNLIPLLGLHSRVEIHHADIRSFSIRLDIVTSRAFRNLDSSQLNVQLGMLKAGGYIMAYKARRESIEGEMGSAFARAELIPLNVPGIDVQRHLVVVYKA